MADPKLVSLLEAVRKDDIKQVKNLIRRVHDTDSRYRALLEAVKRNNTAIADCLLTRGIYHRPNRMVKGWAYLLQYACQHESRQMVELLLSHGADPYITGDFSTCASSNDISREWQMQLKTDMNLKPATKDTHFLHDPYPDDKLISPIEGAIARLDTDMIRLMLKLADRRLTSNEKRYMAMFAAYTISDGEKVQWLAKRCTKENKYFIDIKLREAVRSGQVEHVKMLLPYANYLNVRIPRKIDVNDNTRIGKTPLELAVKRRHTEMCDLLLRNGADINMTAEFGKSLLISMTACCAPDDDEAYSRMFTYLLSHGVDPNLPDTFGSLPLHYELRKGNEVSVTNIKKLLQYGADVNHRNDYNESPLGILSSNYLRVNCKQGYDIFVEVISVLIWAGATVGSFLWLTPLPTTCDDEADVTPTGCLHRRRRGLGASLGGTSTNAQKIRVHDDILVDSLLSLIKNVGAVAYMVQYSAGRKTLKLMTSLVMTGSLLQSEIADLYDGIKEGGLEECDTSKQFLKEFLSNGYSLQELCRLKLREVIRPPLWINVRPCYTRLPKPLAGYLLNY